MFGQYLTTFREALEAALVIAIILSPIWLEAEERAIKNDELLDSDVLLSYDKQDELVAIEVWNASKRGLLKTLADLANEKKEIAQTILKKAQ